MLLILNLLSHFSHIPFSMVVGGLNIENMNEKTRFKKKDFPNYRYFWANNSIRNGSYFLNYRYFWANNSIRNGSYFLNYRYIWANDSIRNGSYFINYRYIWANNSIRNGSYFLNYRYIWTNDSIRNGRNYLNVWYFSKRKNCFYPNKVFLNEHFSEQTFSLTNDIFLHSSSTTINGLEKSCFCCYFLISPCGGKENIFKPIEKYKTRMKIIWMAI